MIQEHFHLHVQLNALYVMQVLIQKKLGAIAKNAQQDFTHQIKEHLFVINVKQGLSLEKDLANVFHVLQDFILLKMEKVVVVYVQGELILMWEQKVAGFAQKEKNLNLVRQNVIK